MSKLMVRIISSLLLVGFLIFLVPVNSWHAAAHSHSSKPSKEHQGGLSIKNGIEKCAFCDLHFPLLYHENQAEITYGKNSFDFLFLDFTCVELPVKTVHLKLRGPPAPHFV
ncbi:hypothetical protein [Fluviicola sp.]|jgi:hypothetical protein|uniref:hypothetical protein n=1 Tax=Fluviicola sp. TaxID=1917219 RepID=UPI002834912B|nr:hypothetical protein [Fluviicola sp.]MDR0802601.1 hypothetical protein [Fluviicola sp.]